jgi:hypothetical protein
MLGKTCSLFRYDACTFGISEEKRKTARATVYGITNNINTLTIELSSFGYRQKGRRIGEAFCPEHIIYISKGIILSCSSFFHHQ